MRQPWFLALCRRPVLGLILAGGLPCAGLGCHPNYYYYYDYPCAPSSPMPSAVQSARVSDVPTQIVEGETKVADGQTRSTTISGGRPTGSRVVVSEPSDAPRLSSSSSTSWRRSDPDGSTAVTSIQGTTNDAAVNR
jgi:hypothetical protein